MTNSEKREIYYTLREFKEMIEADPEGFQLNEAPYNDPDEKVERLAVLMRKLKESWKPKWSAEEIRNLVKDTIINNSEEVKFDTGESELKIEGNAFDHIAEEIAEELKKEN